MTENKKVSFVQGACYCPFPKIKDNKCLLCNGNILEINDISSVKNKRRSKK